MKRLGIGLLVLAASVQAAEYYVDGTNGDDANAGTSWATARASVESGVELAEVGDTVWVTNGTYSISSELDIFTAIALKSVNGRDVTILEGGGSDRCLDLLGVTLDGFTIRNGYVDSVSEENGTGGGVRADSSEIVNCCFEDNAAGLGGGLAATDCTISNCSFVGNSASYLGGGLWASECCVSDSSFQDNYATTNGGGICMEGGSVTDSSITENEAGYRGGGVCLYLSGTIQRSEISGNVTDGNGGGAYFYKGGSLSEVKLLSNEAYHGAGAYYYQGGAMTNALLAGNAASANGGAVYCYCGGTCSGITTMGNSHGTNGFGAGVYTYDISDFSNLMVIENSIIWEEDDPTLTYGSDVSMRYICSNESDDDADEMENLVNDDPCFVDTAGSNYQLQASSPCIDSGTNTFAISTDLAGNARVINGTPDLGAYEYTGFITDSDGDSISDYDEYVADTDADDATDYFCISELILESVLSDSSSNQPVSVQFASSSNRLYTLYSSTNLVNGDWQVVEERMGVEGTDSLSATNSASSLFYKLEVALP